MILEAVAYVEGKLSQPPYELEAAQLTERFGSPWRGGWMEWPAGLASKMIAAQAYARAFQLYRLHNARDKEWANRNPQYFNLVTQVWRWRKEAGITPWW